MRHWKEVGRRGFGVSWAEHKFRIYVPCFSQFSFVNLAIWAGTARQFSPHRSGSSYAEGTTVDQFPHYSRLSVLIRCGPGMPGPYEMVVIAFVATGHGRRPRNSGQFGNDGFQEISVGNRGAKVFEALFELALVDQIAIDIAPSELLEAQQTLEHFLLRSC